MKSKTKDEGDTSDASTSSSSSSSSSRSPSKAQVAAQVVKARTLVAQVVWLVFVVFAAVMAVAALLYAVKANSGNDLVTFFWDRAKNLDLGVFTLKDGLKHFKNDPHHIKAALLNYGLAAIVYLVVGRILERIIKP